MHMMQLVTTLSVLVPFTIAYPLGYPLRILHIAEIASHSDQTHIPLGSPFPALLPDILESTPPSSLSNGAPSSITPGDFATSFVTTLLGGGLALYFT